MQAVPVFRISLAVLWLALAIGCAPTVERPSRTITIDPDLARAAELEAAGQYLAAAELYRQVALRTADPRLRASHLLSAGDAARAGADWDGLRALLEQLDALALDGDQALKRRLLKAESLLQERRPLDALSLLDATGPQGAALALQIRLHRDRAAAYRQMGNLLETANALQAVDALQTDPVARLNTQTEILRSLALLNELVLANLQPSPPGVTGGWMQLALLVKRHGSDPAQLEPLLAEWRQRFPEHPALPQLLSSYQARLQDQLQPASHIAVLLPQSGPFAEVAAAIRDGIVISRFQDSDGKRPELRFYDATDPAGIWPLYNRAVTDGAELVIGPLQKDAVAQLVRAGELPVPVLALNQVEVESAPPTNLFMFALSPEDEAHQAAERAWLDGHRRPVVLTPQGEWGDRVANAFAERWRGLGGSVAAVGRYDSTSHDYTETITQMLHIDQSIERHRQIERWLGRNVEFEPQRRTDIDAIFMAARPVQAQGMRPQLQFHRAGDLPIYATSHAWVGRLTPSQAEDMKGIMLPDIPWLLSDSTGEADTRDAIVRYLPKSASAYARLYAMGMDALRLVPHLRRLRSSRYESLDGSTGNLYMDETNQLHRQLVWVQLDEQAKILGYAPRLDLQGGMEASSPPAPVVSDNVPAS